MFCRLFCIVRSTTGRQHARCLSNETLLLPSCWSLRTIVKNSWKESICVPDGHPYKFQKTNPFAKQCRCRYSTAQNLQICVQSVEFAARCLHILHHRTAVGKSCCVDVHRNLLRARVDSWKLCSDCVFWKKLTKTGYQLALRIHCNGGSFIARLNKPNP